MSDIKPKPTRAEDIEGWMDDSELSWLRKIACRFPSICEIGAYKGRTTHALLTSMTHPQSSLLTIDSWKGSVGEHVFRRTDWDAVYEEFIHNVTDLPLDLFPSGRRPSHTVAVGDSATVGRGIKGLSMNQRFSCVWIDGGHSTEQVLSDLRAWYPLTSDLICGHDYDWPSVKLAVEQYFGLRGETIYSPALCPRIWYVPLTPQVHSVLSSLDA